MANPQIENGHVDLANEIVEALAKIRISGEEMQCLWVIFRKTYGWHKKQDDIALSQFSELTCLKKPAVCRALAKLLSKKIIAIIKNDNGISRYGFNKDFETWTPLSKKITLSKMIKGGIKKDNESLSKKRHTKENLQKKILQKKTDPSIRAFIDFYFSSFRERFGTEPHILPKDAVTAKRLLNRISFDELKDLLLRMFSSDDPWILKSGYTMGAFESQIQKLRIGVPSKHSGLQKWANEIKEEEENGREGPKGLLSFNGDAG